MVSSPIPAFVLSIFSQVVQSGSWYLPMADSEFTPQEQAKFTPLSELGLTGKVLALSTHMVPHDVS